MEEVKSSSSSETQLHLTGIVLRYLDAEWKEALMEIVGQQGHSARFYPWNWERQFHIFFYALGDSWKEVARHRERWISYRSEWVNFMIKAKPHQEQLLLIVA